MKFLLSTSLYGIYGIVSNSTQQKVGACIDYRGVDLRNQYTAVVVKVRAYLLRRKMPYMLASSSHSFQKISNSKESQRELTRYVCEPRRWQLRSTSTRNESP